MKDWKRDALILAEEGELSWRQIAIALGKSKSTVSDFLRNNLAEYKHEERKKDSPKILVLDIETRYLLLAGWAMFNQNFSLDQIEEDWGVLSFSAKWYDSDEVFYEDVSTQTEEEVLRKIYDLLNEADITITHNGRRFDHKKLRARFISMGLPPHAPVRIIDTLEIAKKEFSFTSNKLAYLTSLLCKKHQKSSHSKFAGHLLWKEFLKGNREAIDEMREYNIIDVLSLQELYDILAPWSSKLPVFDVYDDIPSSNSDWKLDGYVYTNLGKYERFRNVKTGQYRRGRTNMLSKEKRDTLLANIV